MKKLINTLTFIALFSTSMAQTGTMESALKSIEENNTSLKALRKQADAEKVSNKTDIFLSGPEVEFNYLWGSPASIGKRKDFVIQQTFDYATISGNKRKLAEQKNILPELEYKRERINILLEAQELYIDLAYNYELTQALSVQQEHAQSIVGIYKRRLDEGDIGILDYNKARLALSEIVGKTSKLETEIQNIKGELTRLNGGEELHLENVQFPKTRLLESFDSWFGQIEEDNPVTQYLKQQEEVYKQEIALRKSQRVPSLSAGYLTERVVGENFSGVTLGLQIPLWENKNKVKESKANLLAIQEQQIDQRLQFFSTLQNLHRKALGLQNTAELYRQALQESNSTELLSKALKAGEISILEYVMELGLYYNNIDQTLQAERDFHIAYAELLAITL